MTKEESLIMKGFAILLMYVHHLFHMSDRVAEYGVISFIPAGTLVKIGEYGNACIALFAFISGYGLTKRYLSKRGQGKNWIKTVIKDILRLQLSVFLVLVVALAVAQILRTHTFSEVYMQNEGDNGLLNVLIDVSGMASLCGKATYNASWWYLKIAIWIMITVPLVNRLCDLLESRKTDQQMAEIGMGGLLLLWIFYVSHIMGLSGDVFFNFLTLYGFLGLFVPCLGVLAARSEVVEKIKAMKIKAYLKWSFAVAGIVLGYIGWHNLGGRTKWLTAFLLTGYILLSVQFASVPYLKDVFVLLGKNSKYMYLFHSFFLSYFFQGHIYGFKYASLIMLMLTVYTLPLSMGFEWVEEHFVKLLRRKAWPHLK